MIILRGDQSKEIGRVKTGSNGEFFFRGETPAVCLLVEREGYKHVGTNNRGKYYVPLLVTPERLKALERKKGDDFYSELCEIIASETTGRELTHRIFPYNDIYVPYLIRALADGRPIGKGPEYSEDPELRDTVRYLSAFRLVRLGSAEGILAAKRLLREGGISTRERSLLRNLVASVVGDPDDREDLDLARQCIMEAIRDQLSFDRTVHIAPVLMLGVSRNKEALNILSGIPFREGVDDYMLGRALKDAMQWQKNKGKRPFGIGPADSDEDQICKQIRNTMVYDDPNDIDNVLSVDKKYIIFNSRKDMAIIEIAIGKIRALGFDVLLKKKNEGWTIIQVWQEWVS